jgi:hypothetical protein
MKKVILFAAFAVVGFASFAQKDGDSKLKFSVGVDAALPIGDFGKSYSFGIGTSAQADFKVADNFAITGSVGYLSFIGKSITIGGTSYKIKASGQVPLLVGGKYNFSENFYGHAQLGYSFSTASGGGSSFTYAPGIGYSLGLV